MPDPVKPMEIEDVLSSIRRLVSEEVGERPRRTAARPEPEPADPPDPADKLVLTPALRVVDDPQSTNADHPDGATSDEGQTEQETEAAEPVEEPAPEPFFERAGQTPEPVGEPEAPESAPHPDDADPWEEISLEDRIAELEAAVSGCEEEWEPDGSEIVQEQRFQFERVDFFRHHVEDEHHDAHPSEQAEPPHVEDETDEAAPDTGPEEDAGLFENDTGGDADVLDEEMLRQLVSDIVREELQGALGERITRNVRKLVRREINRALASRDFE